MLPIANGFTFHLFKNQTIYWEFIQQLSDNPRARQCIPDCVWLAFRKLNTVYHSAAGFS